VRRCATRLDKRPAAANHWAVPDVRTRGVDALLEAARQRIERVAPEVAWVEASSGEALIVDLRSSDERRRHGIVPGSVHVPRSVLEWRADPTSEWRNRHLEGRGRLLLLCGEGFSSSLAAASVADLGHVRVGDVVGGFEAWRAAGLPVTAAPADDGGSRAGTGAADPCAIALTD
jgi:rhodanese-related sulfurtransferase